MCADREWVRPVVILSDPTMDEMEQMERNVQLECDTRQRPVRDSQFPKSRSLFIVEQLSTVVELNAVYHVVQT